MANKQGKGRNKMKTSTKQKVWNCIKIFWWVLGIFILTFLIFSFFQTTNSNNLELVVWVIYLGYSVFAMTIYIAITLLFMLIKTLRKWMK